MENVNLLKDEHGQARADSNLLTGVIILAVLLMFAFLLGAVKEGVTLTNQHSQVEEVRNAINNNGTQNLAT